MEFKVYSLMILGLRNKLINFALLSMAEFDHFDTFPGWVGVGGWGKIEIKDQLSPAEAEIWAELGNKLSTHYSRPKASLSIHSGSNKHESTS